MNLEKAVRCLATQAAVARAELGSPMVIEVVDYEFLSSMAAYTEIVLQHAEAFRVLATTSNQLYFAAASCARPSFEAAVMAAWIGKPGDKLKKEGRWLGIQEGMNKSHRNFAKELADADPTLDESAAPLRELHELLKKREINGQTIPLETKPNAEAMLRDIGFPGMYTVYRELCEIVHVGPEMVLRFKDGTETRGAGKVILQHRMFETDWVIPFLAIGWSISLASMATLSELGADKLSLSKIDEAHRALAAVVLS